MGISHPVNSSRTEGPEGTGGFPGVTSSGGLSHPPWLTQTPLNLPQHFLRHFSSVYLLSYLSIRKFKCQGVLLVFFFFS